MRFLRDGYRVLNLSRRPCPEEGVENLACDLAEPGAVEASRGRSPPGSPARSGSVWSTTHPPCAPSRIDNLDASDLRALLELNLVAPAALNRIAIPHMAAGSSVLYIGSTLAEKAVPGVAGYVIAKHGLAGMMRATCQDLAGRGIHTCMICPGFTDTEQLRALIGDNAETLDAIAGLSAFDRLIEPREIAEAVAFAARSPVLNGALIHANLGQRER